MPTYRVSNGSGVTPRNAKPHAASSMTAARLAARSSQRAGKRCGRCGAICMQNLLAYDVDQLARHDDDALGRTALKETGDFFLGRGDLLDVGLGRLGRHADRAAQLAVDLQHELDFVGHEGGLVDMRPGRVE